MAKKAQKRSKQAFQKWALFGGLAVILIAVVALVLLNGGGNKLQAEISVDEAYKMYNDGAFILDVREVSEWNEYHAPNTTLIPLSELESRLGELPIDQPIVVICRSGNRSQEGRDILLKAGFTQVTSMAGGLKTWRSSGYPVVTGP